MEEKTNYLVHYGVKGMKWRKGRKTPLTEQFDRGVYQYKQSVDQASNAKLLRSSVKVDVHDTKNAIKSGAKKTTKALRKAGSKTINSMSGTILKFKRNGGVRGLFQSGSRKQFNKVTNQIKENAAKRATMKRSIYNMYDSSTKRKRRVIRGV